jgi:DNA repair photolyase
MGCKKPISTTLSAMPGDHPAFDDGSGLPVPDAWRPGRGVAANPGNRFESIAQSWDGDFDPALDPSPATQFLDDATKGVFSRNDSSDVPFSLGLNPYRGCEHGCSYCYARQYHEYLGFSAGLDFETRILVKRDAPRLVREELSSPRWVPQVIGMSGATDCYQPAERRFAITRGCLAVFAECRNPVGIITKNALITRDVDLLAILARYQAVSVALSVTTLDQNLSLAMEPRASVPTARLAAIRTLTDAGVPVGVNIAPIIPGLTDHEIPAIIAAVAAAGASHVGFQIVRLPHGVPELFESWLRHHRPGHVDKVMRRIRDTQGETCDAGLGRRMKGDGLFADSIAQMVALHARRHGLAQQWPTLTTQHFLGPMGRQETLFDCFGA